jgi:RecB family exonuclease
MDDITIILPSARAIRQAQLANTQDTLFLPHYLTMGDFITQLTRVDGYKQIDNDTRTLLLLEASDFKGFASLKIDRNFFTFTKNSQYIFKFFEELSAELYEIEKLLEADVYAEYEEHITILQELYKRYEKVCDERKLLDKIFLPKRYTFNEHFAKNHKHIRVHIDGYVTNFELELLDTLSQKTYLELVFTTSEFNTKMTQKLQDKGFELEKNRRYLLDFSGKKIVQENQLSKVKNVSCEALSERLLQVGFVKKKIYDFIQKGYDPSKIAVVTPDESFAEILRSFDIKSNINFAMGRSYTQTKIYQKLQATLEYFEQKTQQNRSRLERVGDDLYLLLCSSFYKPYEQEVFEKICQEIEEQIENKEEKKVFVETLFRVEKLLGFVQTLSYKSLYTLLLQLLAQQSLDDISGGKITAMGVLETRSVNFDGVIVVDFDERNVPKKSDKDMFLNTQVRQMAKLPTQADREALQKHYYWMLFQNAKEVALCFVQSADSQPSRFIKQLHITPQERFEEYNYAKILFSPTRNAKLSSQEIVCEYNFTQSPLSATKLKTYLTCKRKFYYKYIVKISPHSIPQDIPQEYEVGVQIHQVLKKLYEKNTFFREKTALIKALEREFANLDVTSEVEKYYLGLHQKMLQKFVDTEIERFGQGWRVHATEHSLRVDFKGLTLQGQIDRIDKQGCDLEVLDYKTGSYPLYTKNSVFEATDFQLEFYALLAAQEGVVQRCGYYDLKEGRVVYETFFDEKMALLHSHIADLLRVEEIVCTQCEDTKACTFCEYKLLCGR